MLDEPRVRQQVVDQVGVHSAPAEDADRAVEVLGREGRRLKRLPGTLEEVAVLRIHHRGVARPMSKNSLSKLRRRRCGRCAARNRASRPRGRHAVADQLGRIEIGEAVVAGHPFPERVHVGCTREVTGHADDRDVGLRELVRFGPVCHPCTRASPAPPSPYPPRRASARRPSAPRSTPVGRHRRRAFRRSVCVGPVRPPTRARCAANVRIVG